jgi:hypothetical protein
MSESVKELTPAGRIRRPSYETVVNWVNTSWNAVDISLIQRSFKCCGISNKRDGSEDKYIFDYERVGQTKSGEEIETLEEDDDDDDDYYDDDDEDNSTDEDYYDEEEENYDNDWND